MPYINYDENGKITGQFACPQCENQIYTDLFIDDTDKFKVVDGKIADISQTSEYLAGQEAEQKERLKAELQKQMEELDIKRIRAIAEPQLKDEVTGQTWLEYYTEQIQGLRAQIAEL